MSGQKNMSFVIGAIVCGLAVAATQSYAAEMGKDSFDPSGNNWGVRTTLDSGSEEEIIGETKEINSSAQIPEQPSAEQKIFDKTNMGNLLHIILEELNESLKRDGDKWEELIQTHEDAKVIIPILEHILKPQEYTQDEKNTIFQIAKEAKKRTEEGDAPVDDNIKALYLTVAQFLTDWTSLNIHVPNMRDFNVTPEIKGKTNILMFLMLLKSPHLSPIASVIKDSTDKTMNQRFQLIMDYMDKNVMVKA